MIHLDGGSGFPVCSWLEDKMHTLRVADGSKGDTVTCPRCREIVKEHTEEDDD